MRWERPVFTTDQREFAAAIEGFCAANCSTAEKRKELTDGGRLSNSPRLLEKFAELGWLGVSLPEEYGGGGAGMVEECIFLEETSRGQAPIHAYGTGLTAAQTYLRHGTEQQKKEILGNLCSGRFEAIALSEPGAGSDLGGVSTRARRDGDRFLVNGQKTWITAGHLADHILVLTRTDSQLGKHKGLTLMYTETGVPGLEVRPIQTMDGHTVNDVFLTDVSIPVSNVVGGIDDAWHRLMRGLNVERLIIAAMSLGSARRSLEDTITYVSTREQFGKPIGAFQATRHAIADIATEIEHCRAFVYQVAEQIDAGLEDQLAREGSMAKLKCTEVAKAAALLGMQLMGGNGYTVEFGMEMQVRKALAPPIYGGANAIQREIIGKSYGL
jgi:isovaleryl-CoA dehydrogenase